ncbi:MAG: hypothetical protein DRK00_07420 [Thermoprotei archaeon]|nr:MAG: hypothetical protein DRK00_07420 [Thermoprotei archaeon]
MRNLCEKTGSLCSEDVHNEFEEGIPITIIYDWKDNGLDISDAEHNFGLIADYESAKLRLIKPAYFAIYNIVRMLYGYAVKTTLLRMVSS